MTNNKFLSYARMFVLAYTKSINPDMEDHLDFENTFIVWSCKTLQNHKAIVAADTPDLMLYEITYNGDKEEFYFDAYMKVKNIKFNLKDIEGDE